MLNSLADQVVARINQNVSYDLSKCGDVWAEDRPSANDVSKEFRILAFDVVLERRSVLYIPNQEAAKVLEHAGLIKMVRFEESSHPQALSHEGEWVVKMTAAGRALAARILRYETALRQRHQSDKDFAKWQRTARSIRVG